MTAEEPETTPRRRLTLADLALFVAASAVAVALGLSWNDLAKAPIPAQIFAGWKRTVLWINAGMIAAVPTLLIARFLPPRPGIRQAIRQVGTLTMTLIIGVWMFTAIQVGLEVSLKAVIGTLPNIYFTSLMMMVGYTGRDVAVSWLVLILVGAWRSEPDWVDRSGRIVGVVTILLWIANLVFW